MYVNRVYDYNLKMKNLLDDSLSEVT